jgi:hypothetical protein
VNSQHMPNAYKALSNVKFLSKNSFTPYKSPRSRVPLFLPFCKCINWGPRSQIRDMKNMGFKPRQCDKKVKYGPCSGIVCVLVGEADNTFTHTHTHTHITGISHKEGQKSRWKCLL